MSTCPKWLDWDFFPGSACEEFLKQLGGEGVTSGPWKGIYLGDQNFGSSTTDPDDYVFNADGSCEVKSVDHYFLYVVGKWAKMFLMFYDNGKLIFNIDDETGEKRIDLSVDVNWERFCEVWNDGGVGHGWSRSPISDMMFDGRTTLSWYGKKITVHFEEENQDDAIYSPILFVKRAVYATADRFKSEFGNWEWLVQKSDGWMKIISSWEEFNDLLKKPHTIEYQTDCLQKSYDSSHDDFYQTEVKIAFEDGSALYGASSGIEENYPFIKCVLGFKGNLDDDDYKFALPVALSVCNMWY